MPQISFPASQVTDALTGALDDGSPRHLYDDADKPVATILPNAHYRELVAESRAFEDSQQPKGDAHLPPGYRPYLHSPNATTDRLLPTEPLHTPLARYIHGKDYDQLTSAEQDRVIGAAITVLLYTTLDADSQGAVPILMLSHGPDDPEPRQFWQLAYKTDTPGLYLRAEGNGFFGAEWQIVTGAGLRLFSGWFDRETAGLAAAALGRVLPYIDWMTAGSDDFTARSREAIKGVILRYHFHGVREENPEPDPVTAA